MSDVRIEVLSESEGYRRAHAGSTTIKRAAITNTLLRAQGSGRGRLVMGKLGDFMVRRGNNVRGRESNATASISYWRAGNSGRNIEGVLDALDRDEETIYSVTSYLDEDGSAFVTADVADVLLTFAVAQHVRKISHRAMSLARAGVLLLEFRVAGSDRPATP